MPLYVEPAAGTAFTPDALLSACIEAGYAALLLDRSTMPDEFFDLSSRLAGEVLHALSKYGVRLAAVIGDPAGYSDSFQRFVRESNRGRQYRFFGSRTDAIAWLESVEGS